MSHLGVRTRLLVVGLVVALHAVVLVAQTPTVQAAGPTSVRYVVVDHNVEHRSSAIRSAARQARRTSAQAITLQEVCYTQMQALRRRHPGWTVSWQPVRDSKWCRTRSQPGLLESPERREHIGNVAIWTGGWWGATSSYVFERQLDRTREAGVVCVSHLAQKVVRICTTHLISGSSPRRQRVRRSQAAEVRALTTPWIVRGDDLVVLAGDFNARPPSRTMDHLYSFRGRGLFREALQVAGVRRECRCTQATRDTTRGKIDYVFFSRNHLSVRAPRSLVLHRTRSDHHLLVARARLRLG